MIVLPQDEVAKINSEIIQGVTEEMAQLSAFYLGVTNEWLEAMALAMGIKYVVIDHPEHHLPLQEEPARRREGLFPTGKERTGQTS